MKSLPLPLIIVAGGRSSRMGSDKSLLPFGDFKTLTQYQQIRLEPFFKSIHISTKNHTKFDFEASFIEDDPTYNEHSPLIALLSVLKHFKEPVAILSVDTPFVGIDIFETLYEKMSDTTDAIIAVSPSSSHQLCAIYSPTIIPHIQQALDDNEHKIRLLLEQSRVKYVLFEDDAPFLNLNHPEDYQKAQELL